MNEVRLKEHLLWEVRLVVAIPTNGNEKTCGEALEHLMPALELLEDIIILDEAQNLLCLIRDIKGFGDIAESIAIAKAPASPVRRKRAKATNASQRWTRTDDKELLRLSAKGTKHAHIAKQLGRSTKAVSLRIHNIKKGA
jgi:hypothetical protein